MSQSIVMMFRVSGENFGRITPADYRLALRGALRGSRGILDGAGVVDVVATDDGGRELLLRVVPGHESHVVSSMANALFEPVADTCDGCGGAHLDHDNNCADCMGSAEFARLERAAEGQ